MENKIKSGREILDEYFKSITKIKGVDKGIANMLNDLYKEGKLTDINVKNALQKLREKNVK